MTSTFTAISRSVLDRVRSARSAGHTILLLSDFDGTLTEIVDRPDLAELQPATRQILERLADHPEVHVGIISGRSINDLKQLVGLDQLLLAGTSGIEMDLTGTVIPPPDAAILRTLISMAAGPVRDELAKVPGAWVEEKPYGLTLQLAGISRDSRERIREWLDAELLVHHRLLRAIDCELGIEIIPEIGVTKATAIQRFLDHIQTDSVLVIFAGNDTNDTEALALTSELGGIAIGVGPSSPAAEYHFHETHQFISVLSAILEDLTAPPLS